MLFLFVNQCDLFSDVYSRTNDNLCNQNDDTQSDDVPEFQAELTLAR